MGERMPSVLRQGRHSAPGGRVRGDRPRGEPRRAACDPIGPAIELDLLVLRQRLSLRRTERGELQLPRMMGHSQFYRLLLYGLVDRHDDELAGLTIEDRKSTR